MDPLAEYREKWLPYRMQAMETLGLCLDIVNRHESAPSMRLYADNEMIIEGKVSAFTNPAIEAGILHARALLEFLGLKIHRENSERLIERKKKFHTNDIVIEDYGLSRVTVSQAVAMYPGDAAEAEAGLASPIFFANSWAAHNSVLLPQDPERVPLLRIAARGIPALMVSFFYTPLGLEAPNYKHSTRPKEPAGKKGEASDA